MIFLYFLGFSFCFPLRLSSTIPSVYFLLAGRADFVVIVICS